MLADKWNQIVSDWNSQQHQIEKRRALLRVCTEGNMAAVLSKVVELARNGNLKAIRLVLDLMKRFG